MEHTGKKKAIRRFNQGNRYRVSVQASNDIWNAFCLCDAFNESHSSAIYPNVIWCLCLTQCPSQTLTHRSPRAVRSSQLKESLWEWSVTGPQPCRQHWPVGGPLRGRAPLSPLLTSRANRCIHWLTVRHETACTQKAWTDVYSIKLAPVMYSCWELQLKVDVESSRVHLEKREMCALCDLRLFGNGKTHNLQS